MFRVLLYFYDIHKPVPRIIFILTILVLCFPFDNLVYVVFCGGEEFSTFLVRLYYKPIIKESYANFSGNDNKPEA